MNEAAIVAATTGGPFLAGLAIGVLLGLLLSPLLRSWVAWREWVQASREADLTDRLLTRMEQDPRKREERPEAREIPASPVAAVPGTGRPERREGPVG